MTLQRPWSYAWPARALGILALGTLLVSAPGALARDQRAVSQPKPGGSINVRLFGPPECLDPAKASLTFDGNVDYPVLDTLLSLNDKNNPVPYLAQSYKSSQGGKLLTLNLRHDATFSDGRPLTAADVKYTFDRVLDPATKSPIAKTQLGPVTTITTSGKYTVKIHLSTPYRAILNGLTSPYLGIVERKSVDAAGSNTCNGLVGSGPFKISNVGTAYASVTLTRNKRHTFGPGWAHNKGPAYLSSLTFQSIPNDTTAISELLGGQLDISDVAGDQLSRVQGNKSLTLFRVLAQREGLILFNGAHAPFNNLAVRKAVGEAIDRAAIIQGALDGLGKPAYGPIPQSTFDYNPKIQSYLPKHDVAAARKAIAAAGAKGPYTMVTYTLPATAAATEIIQSELSQVGMTVNIESDAVPTWLNKMKEGEFDMSLLTFSGATDPDLMYQFFNSSQKASGLDFWNLPNNTIDRLTLAGRTTLDLKKAKADYFKAQQVFDQQVIGVPLWVPITVTAFRHRVQGIHITAGNQIQFQDLYIGK